ncbi:FAD binding domain-containing protein [Neobacillus niacini]|uniref:FAD binding domain-containing protein n=1 Tax=Neobacillus niacini TaxID=86668 RepID=UPI0005F06D67|nr:FAD binding domain-containing protein [Neobacillus niacini]
MLAANIEYYKPATIQAALEQFYLLKNKRKRPIYYGGGTEVLTLGRLNLIETDAVIDLKGIRECQSFEFDQEYLITGAALPLTYIEEKNLFPLLTSSSMGIADHTARNKITIGGNICGQIFYREAVLPFLICESKAVIAGENGIQIFALNEIFNETLQLEEGQFLLQLLTEKRYIHLPFVSIKKRQQWDTGYPLLTVAAVKVEDQIRFAFSGLCPFPFRSRKMEDELNNLQLPLKERISRALLQVPSPILDDIEGSKDYRLFVLRNTLNEIILDLEGK